MSDLQMTVENSLESIEHLRNEWDQCVLDTHSTIYMSYDWCSTWWQFYGKGRRLQVLLFYNTNKLAGILPMYTDRIHLGVVTFSVARLVGSNTPPKIFNPPIPKELADSIFDQALNYLLVKEKCDVVSFGPISDKYSSYENLLNISKRQNATVIEKRIDVHSLFTLPGSFNEYLSVMSKKEQKKLRYEINLLNRNKQISSTFETDISKTKDIFNTFADLHKEQWNMEGRPGHFAAWPLAKGYNYSLMEKLSKLDRFRFYLIKVDDTIISCQYAYIFGNTCYWELPARSPDLHWRKYSLGRTGLAEMIKLLIESNIKYVQGGLGKYEYKVKMGAQEYNANIVRIVSSRRASKFRYAIFSLVTYLVVTIYHKIWYRRIQPHLPAKFQWPIWPFRIRLDF